MPIKVDVNSVDVYSDGRLQLIVGLCEKMGVKDIFNRHLEKEVGRPSDIPAGVEAEVMIAGICIEEGYRPLYAIQDYYQYKDLEGIFHHPLELSQLNDDRFGHFLDGFYRAGCRRIFMEISARAFAEYGIAVRNINYDTTSKVMWGEYESTGSASDGEISHISINFGHSKNKRSDKRQIKIALGTTNGVVTDAKVLSGNMDDKTYNKENIEDVDKLLKEMKVDRSDFYYIADSALFTEENITRAKKHNIMYITRMPNNLKIAKAFLEVPLDDAQTIVIENAQNKKVTYRFVEEQTKYEGHDVKLAVIYSEALENTKRNTCQRNIKKERKQIEQAVKKYRKRMFKCEADAVKEVALLETKLTLKLKYHNVEISVTEVKKKRPGRPSKNPEQDNKVSEYQLSMRICLNESKVEDLIRRECTFILCSNNLLVTGEKMIREYKTQSDVEKRFKVLKSPKFMNSLFLKTPQRVEALVYLLLIALMMLTVAERIVRDDLKKGGEVLHGTEKRKLKKPTFSSILQIMDRVRVVRYVAAGKIVREIRNIDASCKKIIKFLGLEESCFAWNSS